MNTKFNLMAAVGLLAAVSVSVAQPVVEFSASTYVRGENAGTVPLTVLRSGDFDSPVTVDYATADDSAVASVKYTVVSGTGTGAATRADEFPCTEGKQPLPESREIVCDKSPVFSLCTGRPRFPSHRRVGESSG